MKAIRHTATLFYYDGPQVIEGRDAIGGHYVAVLLEPDDEHDRYLVTGAAPERLRQFRAGTLELRALMSEGGMDEWYLAKVTGDLDQPLVLVPQAASLADTGFLPDEGFLLHDRPADELALREARERNNLVLEIAAEPPEAASEHRIRLGTLIGLLGHVQTLIRHSYGAVLRKSSSGRRRPTDWTEGYLLDVVTPAMAGSFRVVLQAAKPPDLLGQMDLAQALHQVDALFADAADSQKTLASLRAHRGHFAGAYLRLLRFLVQHKTGLRYSWAEPTFSRPSYRAVGEAEAGSLVDMLSGVSNLGAETVVLVGEFERGNRGTGAWGLLTEDGVASGKVREGGPVLDGLKVGGRYRFTCIEEIEEVESTGREQHSLYLTEYEPA